MVGLGDDGERPVGEYSKGMKTRLGVARALLNDPQLIFLDEPTVGLDPVSRRRIRDLVQEMKKAGRTVFLTTHDMTVADELCDHVAFIVNGEIQLVESPRDLKLAHGARTVVMEYDLGRPPRAARVPARRARRQRRFPRPAAPGRRPHPAHAGNDPRGRLPASHRPRPAVSPCTGWPPPCA